MNAKIVSRAQERPVGGVGTGTSAHCRRVAAWCEELSRKLQFSTNEANALVEAALQHHHPKGPSGASLSRLMGDLGLQSDLPAAAEATVSKLAERILTAYHSCTAKAPNDRAWELAKVLEAADCFDEQLEYAPFEPDGIERVLQHAMEEQHQTDDSIGFVLQNLRRATREDLLQLMPKLPVYPAIAMRLYRMLASADVTLSDLESVAKTDQVVAGKLVRAANSVFYSPWQPIKSVGQAISYVGTRDARRILLASSIQPLFATPRLRRLWQHALEAAQVAERIAALSGKVDPAEAFLLGLLHDVGKLAIALLSKSVNDAVERLLDKGCQPAVAELVLCGFDHAEAGAEVMRYWKFSEEVIAAVQHHHQPERMESPMAAILYLTEFWTDSEEDIPSNARLYTALRTLSITMEDLEKEKLDFNPAMLSL